MKKKALVLILIAGMLTSGFTANTFASDSDEDFVQFSEETESTDEIADKWYYFYADAETSEDTLLSMHNCESNFSGKNNLQLLKQKVATITTKGIITTRKKGTAIITVKSGKIQTKCRITVK